MSTENQSKKRLFDKITQRNPQETTFRIEFVKRRRFLNKTKVERMALIGATDMSTGRAVKLMAFSNTFDEYVLSLTFYTLCSFASIKSLQSEDLVRIENVSKRSRGTFYLEKYSSISLADCVQSSARETLETRCHSDISGLDFFKTPPMYLKEIAPMKESVFFKCSCCHKKKTEYGPCSQCTEDQGEDLEVSATGLFLDGVGGRLRAKITANIIYLMLGFTEETLSAFLETNSVEDLGDRLTDEELFHFFVSATPDGKFFEVEFARRID